MKNIRYTLLLLIIIFSVFTTVAQVRQSPTPIIVNLITPTPASLQQAIATVTPTFTPTPKGPVLLEARESAGNVNVRAEPDPNGERLGNIAFGTQYPVLRQFFSWYELQYDLSPSGRAWVYGELVDIVGDVTEIEIVDTLDQEPTQDNVSIQATETWLAITSAPGGLQTATANARVLSVPTLVEENLDTQSLDSIEPLPTYTYPPDVILIVPTTSDEIDEDVPLENESFEINQFPPIFLILILGGFGIIGLLISSLRR